jgi:DNA polymerase-4
MQTRPSQKSLDPLFAAVEIPHFLAQTLSVWNPELRGRSFAVIEQNAESHKTPLLAVSETAAKFGLTPGIPIFIAKRRWPDVQILMRDLPGEATLRKTMSTHLLGYTPLFTIRESGGAVLDMTGTPVTRKATPEIWAYHLQKTLRDLGLEAVSIGIASSQIVAQVLARLNKPHGIQVCPMGNETSLLDPLLPELLPGLSSHTRELLRKYGLASISNIRRLDKEEILLRFGSEGEKLYSLVRGWDFETISSGGKAIVAESLLSQDLNDQETLRSQVRLTADKLGHALRLKDCKAARVTLVLTYSDKRSVRRTTPLHPPTSAFPRLAEKATHLFEEIYQRRVALRRIQLQVTLPRTDTGQLDLFDEVWVRKQHALEAAIDRIRCKRNFQAVLSGSNVMKRSVKQEPSRRGSRI